MRITTRLRVLVLIRHNQFWLEIIKDLVQALKRVMELSNTNKIIVVGSLAPDKLTQDRVRVLDAGGQSQALRATDYKDPPKILVYEK